jgi:hypothetical protein
MKLDWKKQDKKYYLPKEEPELVHIPELKFFSIRGQGNPNDDFFGNYIQVLYSLSYAIKMSPKSGLAPLDYFEYSVYPLEGIWDLKENAKIETKSLFDKNDLEFNLMIRQPDFVNADFANKIINIVKKKKPNNLLENVIFETITDGKCIQMLHVGPYDNEPASFKQMEEFTVKLGLIRPVHYHREIYLSDVRKVSPNKLKTVLRYKVQ